MLKEKRLVRLINLTNLLVQKKDDHSMDELRYYVMSRPENHFKLIKNTIQKDKERLFRKAKNERYGKRI